MGMLDWFRRREPEKHQSSPRRLRELEIITARLVRAGIAGQVQAAFHGRGIEFSQVRLYHPGDDVRSIDWNVTARSGVPHVKEYVEERDLTVILCLDVSGSMGFGSLDRRKIDVASELVSVLAFAARLNRDRIGLLLFAEDVVDYLPPSRDRSRARQIVHRSLDAAGKPRGRSNLEGAIRFLERVLRRRSIVVMISDFLDVDATRLSRLRRRHDVVAMRILDPREERLPSNGLVRIVDLETGEPMEISPR
ncbi:MAG: DUF58 domain-containing protein, partial [Thermoanaerobaculia bacterium]|nr:DUF58 domain-containing protein [Thermoanaerobaculia bacterium]